MKIEIKDFSIDMEIKNKGIELDVTDNEGEHLGDLIIGKAKLTWCKGKKQKKNGIEIEWKDLIEFFDSKNARR